MLLPMEGLSADVRRPYMISGNTISTGRSKILAAQFFPHTLHSELMLLTSMEKLSDSMWRSSLISCQVNQVVEWLVKPFKFDRYGFQSKQSKITLDLKSLGFWIRPSLINMMYFISKFYCINITPLKEIITG